MKIFPVLFFLVCSSFWNTHAQDAILETMLHTGNRKGYYLGDDLPVCWVTLPSGVSVLANDCLVFGLDLRFSNLEGVDSLTLGDVVPIEYIFTRESSGQGCDSCIADLNISSSSQRTHSNVHFCPSSVLFCTPFYEISPDIGTFTSSQKFDMFSSHAITMGANFSTEGLAVSNKYFIMAHLYFTTEDQNGDTYRWDIAYGKSFLITQQVNYHFYSLGVKVLCYSLCGILVSLILAFAMWTYWYRDTQVVIYSQPIFLYTLLAGALVYAMSIIPAGVQDSLDDLATEDGSQSFYVNFSCMLKYWFSVLGFALLFGTLISKILRAYRIVHSSSRLRRVEVRRRFVICGICLVMSVFTIALSIWQAVAPLEYQRTEISPGVSIGHCEADSGWLYFVGTIYGMEATLLILGCVMAYLSVGMNSIMNESKYVSMAMVSLFQLNISITPLLYFVDNYPSIVWVMWTVLIFLTAVSVLMFIFVPKILAVRRGAEVDLNIFKPSSPHQLSSGSGGGFGLASLSFVMPGELVATNSAYSSECPDKL